MTDQKKPKLTPEEEAQVFVTEYEKLCAKYGLIHAAIPFPTDTAIVQAKLQIVRLVASME